MRHARLCLMGLAIVCTVLGLLIGRSFEEKPPVGGPVAEAEVHVRPTARVETGGALEEPRRLPEVAARPLVVPVKKPLPRSHPRAASQHESSAAATAPFDGRRATENEPGRFPMDDTYRLVRENPLRRGSEKPRDVATPRNFGWPDVESRPPEAVWPRATYLEPIGVPSRPSTAGG